MKFIHFADAHLDSPFRGLSFLPTDEYERVRASADESLTRIVDLAIAERVDLVLVAGDSFDSNKPSPASQLFFAKQLQRLTDAQIQVVMIFGNHDYMQASDLLVKQSPYFKLLGDGQEVERADFVTKSGFKYSVTGFSYAQNHIEEDMIPHFPPRGSEYAFGLMHAAQKAANGNVYAPFALNELKDLQYDYFALGHIHAGQVLADDPWIVYPGNIQGRDIGELGGKGCILGTVDEASRKTTIDFKPTASIVWRQVSLELAESLSKSELEARVVRELAQKCQGKTYFSLELRGTEYLTGDQLEFWADEHAWESVSQQLPADSRLVDVRFAVKGVVKLSGSDQEAFKAAEAEVLADEQLKAAAKTWLKKDQLAQELFADPQFIAGLKQLVKVKLAERLAGLKGEIDK